MLIRTVDRKVDNLLVSFVDGKIKSPSELREMLKKEAKFPHFYFFLVNRLFELALERKLVINSHQLIKDLLLSPYHYEHFMPNEVGSASEDEIEYFPGLIFSKGVTSSVLESLGLKDSLHSFLCYLIIGEEEINSSLYLTQDQTRRFGNMNSVIDIFVAEYEEKLNDKPQIIRLGS